MKQDTKSDRIRFFKYTLATGVVVGLLASGCLSGPAIPEEDTPGAQVFKNKCTLCHGWPHPHRHTIGEWDHYLTLMQKHMKDREVAYTQEEIETIREYLHRNARK